LLVNAQDILASGDVNTQVVLSFVKVEAFANLMEESIVSPNVVIQVVQRQM
jgi:hypothetical protein